MDLAEGLAPGNRFRCTACGNLTRFDVVATERTRRFHHLDLGGAGEVEEEELLARTVERVSCRWCNRDDAIAVEPVAGAASDGDPHGTPDDAGQ
jgi:transposase